MHYFDHFVVEIVVVAAAKELFIALAVVQGEFTLPLYLL